MKGITEAVVAVVLIAVANAQPHQHQHRHRHVKKHDHSPVELAKRDVTWVSDVQTVYIDENGNPVGAQEAVSGIADGLYIVVGETTPTFTPPPQPSSTAASSSEAAEFYEQKPTAPPAPAPAAATTAPPPPAGSNTPGGTGLNANFPSGQIPCSAGVPTQYGPIELPQLNLNGWAGFQVPSNGFTPGVAIDNIVAPISGGCPPGAFCSYACPPGTEKSQWPPSSQGASGQSVGGLWCNSAGFLELTNPAYQQLCIPGAGGIFVQNNLPGSCAICRTDYPGSEAMVIPLNTLPGQTYPLTNTPSSSYYIWENAKTTAQYYVNPVNVDVADACVWNSPSNPTSAGNWAPMNVGVGQDDTGMTYLSIFYNLPTSNAPLGFNMKITGDVSGTCSYDTVNGFTGGTANGCTVAVPNGGTATIVLG